MSKKKTKHAIIYCFPIKNLHHKLRYAKQLNSYTTAGMEKPSSDTVWIKMSYGVKLIFFHSDLAKVFEALMSMLIIISMYICLP